MNSPINITIDIDNSTYKQIIEGTEILNKTINYDRAASGRSPVNLKEDYFLRQAIWSYLELLRNDMKNENFN